MADHEAVSSGVRASSRTATTRGNDADSDFVVLRQLRKELTGMTSGRVQRIVIFKATGPGASVPVACLTAAVHQGVSDAASNTFCNVYNADDFASSPANFGCVTSYPSYFDCGWKPTTRNVAVSSGTSPDYIGVYVQATHTMLTGFFGATYTLKSTAVYPIEPRLIQ